MYNDNMYEIKSRKDYFVRNGNNENPFRIYRYEK